MKLDKTLEEITTYNKSLNNPTGEVAKEYFKLRILNDRKLSTLKSVQNDEKSKFKRILKQLTLISIQKIDFNISAYKNNVKSFDDISKISAEIFDVILNTFESSNRIYYENNKEHILNYITSVYKCRLEMKNLNAELCDIINTFVKNNNIKQHKLAQLVSLYQNIKKELRFYSFYCNDIEDYKYFQTEKDELLPFAEEVFLEEVCKINSKRELDKMVDKHKEQKDLDYKRSVSEYYTPKVGNSTKEFVVQTVLNETCSGSMGVVENVIHDIVLNNKVYSAVLNKLQKSDNKPPKKKTKISKEEKDIQKINQKTTNEVLKSMGFI